MSAELAVAAQDLFLVQGYDATTIDQIAEAVGMSKRSFFRYFATKEDVIVSRYEEIGEQQAARLNERPLDEPAWLSLRHTLQLIVDSFVDEQRRVRVLAMQQIISASPAAYAAYLRQSDAIQSRLAVVLAERAEKRGGSDVLANELPRALAGAAFACLISVLQTVDVTDDPAALAPHLDAVMAAMRPANLPG